MLTLEAARQWEAPPIVSSAEWLEDHVIMPAGTETGGLPFSLAAFPHVDGVLVAFDDPAVRRIVLQWGTRLGKTTTCLSLVARVAGTRPRNMMFASSTKNASSRVVSSRLYPILEGCDAVAAQLPPRARRSNFLVRLAACLIFVGWSGSDTSLADVGAWFGIANEVDKWDTRASDEADPLDLFANRFKGFTDHKIIIESTPTIRNRSRVERELLASNQHRRYVPCPHCGEFQILRKGDAASKGGIKWEHDSRGKSDADLAFRTAYYECEHCQERIDDHHRVPMLRRGAWVPDGCRISAAGKITGRAHREGSDTVGFGPLPSWYALTERWGNFARAWVQAQGKPRKLQDVINSYLAETYEHVRSRATWEELGQRLIGQFPRGIVPADCSLITAGVDRQADHYVHLVEAWAPGRRSRVIDYGTLETLDQVRDQVIRRSYPHADGGRPLLPALTLLDTGFKPVEERGEHVHEFCAKTSRAGNRVLPCKGSSAALSSAYEISVLGKRSAAAGRLLVLVDTFQSQDWLEQQLHVFASDADGGLAIYQASPGDHQDLLEQLLNDTSEETLDAENNTRISWVRRDENVPNDYRDSKRYADTAMLIETRGGPIRPRSAPPPAADKPKTRLTMPDGRPFLITER